MAAAIANAVSALPGATLTAGPGVAVATQYAGGSVEGVGLTEDLVTVQIVSETVQLRPLTEAVWAAATAVLARAGDPRPVHVHVADLHLDRWPSGVQT